MSAIPSFTSSSSSASLASSASAAASTRTAAAALPSTSISSAAGLDELFKRGWIIHLSAEKLSGLEEGKKVTSLNRIIKLMEKAAEIFKSLLLTGNDKPENKDEKGFTKINFTKDVYADFNEAASIKEYRSGILFLATSVLHFLTIHQEVSNQILMDKNVKNLTLHFREFLNLSQLYLKTVSVQLKHYVNKCESVRQEAKKIKFDLTAILTSKEGMKGSSRDGVKLHQANMGVITQGIELSEEEKKVYRDISREISMSANSSLSFRLTELRQATAQTAPLLLEVSHLQEGFEIYLSIYDFEKHLMNCMQEFKIFEESIQFSLDKNLPSDALFEFFENDHIDLNKIQSSYSDLRKRQQELLGLYDSHKNSYLAIRAALENIQKLLIDFKIFNEKLTLLFDGIEVYKVSYLAFAPPMHVFVDQSEKIHQLFNQQPTETVEIVLQIELLKSAYRERAAFVSDAKEKFQEKLALAKSSKKEGQTPDAAFEKMDKQFTKCVETMTQEVKGHLETLEVIKMSCELNVLDDGLKGQIRESDEVMTLYQIFLRKNPSSQNISDLSQKRIKHHHGVKALTEELKKQKNSLLLLEKSFEAILVHTPEEMKMTYLNSYDLIEKKLILLQSRLSHLYLGLQVIKSLAMALAFKRYPAKQLEGFDSFINEIEDLFQMIEFEAQSSLDFALTQEALIQKHHVEIDRQTFFIVKLSHLHSEYNDKVAQTEENMDRLAAALKLGIEATKKLTVYNINEKPSPALNLLFTVWNDLQIVKAYSREQNHILSNFFTFTQALCRYSLQHHRLEVAALSGVNTVEITMQADREYEELAHQFSGDRWNINSQKETWVMEKFYQAYDHLLETLSAKEKVFKNKMGGKMNLISNASEAQDQQWLRESEVFHSYFHSLFSTRQHLMTLLNKIWNESYDVREEMQSKTRKTKT